VTSEALRSVAAAVEPQQVAAATTTVMTMAVTALLISPAPAPAPVSGSQAAVVEISDDDTPLPGWDQWVSLPAPAPELPVGALVVRDDGCVMSGRSSDGVEASSSHAVLPASDGAAARPEQERERAITPPAHFADAQAEQELWQEFHDHGASLNRALNEALRIHSGHVWRVFQVRDLFVESCDSSPFVPSASALSLIGAPWCLSAGDRNWRIAPRRGMAPLTR
jgi:hypothetical protein